MTFQLAGAGLYMAQSKAFPSAPSVSISGNAASGGGKSTGGGGKYQAPKPKSPVRLSTNAAKSLATREGYKNVEALKDKFKTSGKAAHWDIFRDKSTGDVWLGNKNQTVFINTGIKY